MIARKLASKRNLTPGHRVVLRALPEGFIDDLPQEDQRAVSVVIGQRILLNGYDADGRAELEFTDAQGIIHFIYVDPKFLNNPGQ
jgi:hypothetical protein